MDYGCKICGLIQKFENKQDKESETSNLFYLPLQTHPPSIPHTMCTNEFILQTPGYDLDYFNHKNDLKIIDNLINENRILHKNTQCIISEDKKENPRSHPKMLREDLNWNTGSLLKGMFQVCSTLAFGDCGFLAILWAINSDPHVSTKIFDEMKSKQRNIFGYKKKNGNMSFDVKFLRNILLQDKYDQSNHKYFADPGKSLVTTDFMDNPLIDNRCEEYDEKVLKAYDKIREQLFNDVTIGKEKIPFLKLITRTAEDTTVSIENLYCLTNVDILFLPIASNGKVGALCVQQQDDCGYIGDACCVSDFGYYDFTGRHLFETCEYFIIMRHINGGGGHFDYFYSLKSKSAIFRTNSTEAKYILSLCNDTTWFKICGKDDMPENLRNRKKFIESYDGMRFPTNVVEWFDWAYHFVMIIKDYERENNTTVPVNVSQISTQSYPHYVNDWKQYISVLGVDFVPVYLPLHKNHKYYQNRYENLKYHMECLVIIYLDKDNDNLLLLDCNMMKIPRIFKRENLQDME